ncbi:hypothetical protein ACP3TJ_04835 [Desulforudis sp. 1088]
MQSEALQRLDKRKKMLEEYLKSLKQKRNTQNTHTRAGDENVKT